MMKYRAFLIPTAMLALALATGSCGSCNGVGAAVSGSDSAAGTSEADGKASALTAKETLVEQIEAGITASQKQKERNTETAKR